MPPPPDEKAIAKQPEPLCVMMKKTMIGKRRAEGPMKTSSYDSGVAEQPCSVVRAVKAVAAEIDATTIHIPRD